MTTRTFTFSILVLLVGCSAPLPEPAPEPAPVSSSPIDAGDPVDATDSAVDAPPDDVSNYGSCGEIFVIHPDGSVTKTEFGPCHT